MTTTDHLTVGRRFRGPPNSGNGGYVAGLLARHIDGAARVTLLAPIPLEVPLALERDGNSVRLVDGGHVIAEAEPATLEPDPPPVVDFDRAIEGSKRYRGAHRHAFPGCFVCGPERRPGDGLCLFTGPIDESGIVAAPWVPDPGVADASGLVHPEIVWASLDCPSYFGVAEGNPDIGAALLGRIVGRIMERPRAGERYVVVGWPRGREGRKLYGGAAVIAEDGKPMAVSQTVWIQPRPPEP